MGQIEKSILEQCYRSKMPVPDKILNSPELLFGLELYYTGFLDLSSCRSFGFAEGPIPWISIMNYANHKGLYDEDADCFVSLISQMDSAYLKYKASKTKSGE